MTFYNARSHAQVFRVTKFTDDLEVESSYLTHAGGCECPQFTGRGKTCRHMKMLPRLCERADTAWFFDYDRQAWVDPTGRGEDPVHTVALSDNLPDNSISEPTSPIFLNQSEWDIISATGQDMSGYRLQQPIPVVSTPAIRRRF